MIMVVEVAPNDSDGGVHNGLASHACHDSERRRRVLLPLTPHQMLKLLQCLSRWGRIFIAEPIGLPSEETPGVEDQFVNGCRPLPACLG